MVPVSDGDDSAISSIGCRAVSWAQNVELPCGFRRPCCFSVQQVKPFSGQRRMKAPLPKTGNFLPPAFLGFRFSTTRDGISGSPIKVGRRKPWLNR